MKNENTFLLGLGNQKCGTTWLHKYLKQNDNFKAGAVKEYHIWDAVDVPFFKDKLVDSSVLSSDNKRAKHRYRMQNDEKYYFDYFSAFYNDTINLTADITPSYSALDVPRLEIIRDQFAERGIATKAIILIRDPVSRIKSALRYNMDRNYFRGGVEDGETDYLHALSQYYNSEHCRLRTSYHKIIPKAFEVFGRSNVYIGVYESMFELEEIEKLSAFCGVPVKPEYASVYVNKTKNAVNNSAPLEAEIRDAYSDVYEYCHDVSPSTRKLWS